MRELDKLIVEKVFQSNVKHLNETYGFRRDYLCEVDNCNEPIYSGYIEEYVLKNYSEDISAAWSIVDIMTEKYKGSLTLIRNSDKSYSCSFDDYNKGATCETAPEAICRAALKLLAFKELVKS